MTFNDDEIERERRKATSRKASADYDQLQARRDILFAAMRDSPEEFKARLVARGIDLNSEHGRKVMAAYWAIPRGPRR
jgi:hypothetical protein